MRNLCLFCLLVVAPSLLYSQYTIDTLRHLNIIPSGGYSAIWGYTAPNGREYAILGCNGVGGRPAGTSFIDITDNGNVHQVSFVPGPASTWREMKTYRQYAYIVTEGSGSGTQIVDLSYLPDSVHLVRTFVYTSGTKNTSKSHTITITDGFMYLNGCANWGTQAQRGMVIFDLSGDPTNPQFVGEYSPDYIHDSYVLRDTIFGSAIYTNGGVYIADARNKANVQTIGKIGYTGSGTHNSWVTKDRRYVITTDEIGTITPKQLLIWDIGNLPTIPSAPAATFTVNPSIVVHNVTVRGDFAYSVWYSGRGIQIVDVSNPQLPVLGAGYTIAGSSALDWGIYPYFPSGKIVIGDGTNGLWVFRFSGLPPRVPVTLLQPAHGDTARGASATFRWTKSADLNKDPHYYQVRLRGPGVDTTWRSNDSVSVFGSLSRLQAGQTYWWSVITRDEWNTTASPDSFRIIREVSTGVANDGGLPDAFSLSQNYPNPFNPTTTIRYQLPTASFISLRVYSMIGEEVATLVHELQSAGKKEVAFDARSLPSGVYVYWLTAAGYSVSKKLVLIK